MMISELSKQKDIDMLRLLCQTLLYLSCFPIGTAVQQVLTVAEALFVCRCHAAIKHSDRQKTSLSLISYPVVTKKKKSHCKESFWLTGT